MSKFLGYLAENQDQKELTEAFNTEAYELTFGKKNAGDIYFTFIDEDGKEFRIQFYTPAGLGKNVRQVFIGQKKGSIYPDVITKFKNPLKVIASMIEATKQYLVTPIGRGIDGFAINFSKRALERGLQLVPKIIRQSGLKQKLNVMDLTYSPDPSRGYVWVIRKGKDPAQVFDGPKMQGITWDDPDRVGDGNTGDASNAGNPPVIAPATNQPSTGWDIIIAPEGNPNIEYRDPKGMMLGGIGVRFTTQYVNGSMKFSPLYGEFMGSSKAVNFRNIDGKDIKRIAKELKLPPIPADKAQAFTKAAEAWWASKGSDTQDISDTKWNALIDAMKKSYVGNSVKVVGWTAVGQVMKDGIKVIVGLIRNSEMVAMNLDAYDKDNKQVSLPVSSRSFPDVDVNNPGALTKVMNLAIDVVVEISSREAVVTGGTGVGQWKYSNTQGGQPQMVYSITKGVRTYTAMLAAHATEEGVYVLNGSDHKNFRGTSAAGVINQARLPEPPTDMYNQFYRDSKTFWETTLQFDFTKLRIPATGKVTNGNPNGITVTWGLATSTTISQDKGVIKFVTTPDGKPAFNMEIPSGDLKNIQWYLDGIPGMLAKMGAGAPAGPNLANLQDKMPSGATLNVIPGAPGEVTIDWSVKLPNTTAKTEEISFRTGIQVDSRYAYITNYVLRNGQIINNPKSYNISIQGLNALSVLGNWLETQSALLQRYRWVISQFADTNYNPTGAMPDVTWKNDGEMYINGQSAKRLSSSQVLSMMPKADKDIPNADKGGLAALAAQIENRAPTGRDLDWNFYLQNQGSMLRVDWDITFRRNTRAGAVREYQSQVNSANAYVQAVVNLAKAKGFNVQDPRIMTVAMADEGDRNSAQNGDGAYSEYEQSIGGGVTIEVKLK